MHVLEVIIGTGCTEEVHSPAFVTGCEKGTLTEVGTHHLRNLTLLVEMAGGALECTCRFCPL